MSAIIRELIEMLLNPGSQVGLLINASIATIGVIALLRVMVLSASLVRENNAIRRVARRTQEHCWEDAAHTVDEAASGDEGETAITTAPSNDQDWLLSGIDSNTMVAQRVRALRRLKHVSGAATDALSRIDGDHAQVRLSFLRYAANVPIMLGLMGTLWGLAQAVTHVQPLIAEIDDIKSLPQLLGAMVSTLAGMKTAFTTSITGLLVGLLLSLLATWVSKYYQEVLRSLDNLTTLELTPLLAVPEEGSARLAFAEALKEGTARLQTVGKDMTTWTSNLCTAISEARNGQDLVMQAATTLKDGADKLLGFQSGIEGRIEKHYENLEAALGAFNDGADKIGTTQASVNEALSELDDLIKAANGNRKADQGAFETSLKGITGEVTVAAERSADAIEELKKLATSLQEANTEHSKQLLQGVLNSFLVSLPDFFESLTFTAKDTFSQHVDRVLDNASAAGSSAGTRPVWPSSGRDNGGGVLHNPNAPADASREINRDSQEVS